MDNRPQIRYINIAKGFAIFAVVLWHLRFEMGNDFFPIANLFGAMWHVPVFFMLSGFFIREEKLLQPKSFIRNKMKRLYIMLLYYYFPATLMHNCLLDWGWYDTTIDYHGKFVTYWNCSELLKRIAECMAFAGREPIMGAMWFVYVLLLAFIGYSLVSTVVHRIVKEEKKYEIYKALLLLFLVIVSCVFSEKFSLTIPRVNNTFTAIWLIYCGYIIRNVVKVDFNNGYVAIAAFLLLYHTAMIGGGISLNRNYYHDAFFLTGVSFSALYIVCYLSRKIEFTWGGIFLEKCGKESFHIMALHLVGFKFGIIIINLLGANIFLADQMPKLGSNYLYVVILFTFGITFPLVFMYLFRKVKTFVIVKCQRCV
ncbi:MAG: acyltransferase family protein [Bacteroidaceae bacterium]|nr:acyltransferase family protein [Bacteroidaceae bacterium]